MSNNYHNDLTAISKSKLDLINRSPAHYKYFTELPDVDTDAMRIGRVAHAYILEKISMVIAPFDSFRTKEARQWRDEQTMDWVKLSEAESIKGMRNAVHSHRVASQLLESGEAERVYKWTDLDTFAECKCRVDWQNDGVIVDLKTTDDASASGFARSARRFRYDVQAAFYSDGIEQATGKRPEAFIFIAVEKSPPYGVGIYTINPESIELARLKYRDNLRTWMMCKSLNKWPSYNEASGADITEVMI